MSLTVRALRGLGPIDVKSVLRDGMLRWMALLPLGIALLMRWGVPAIQAHVAERYGFDLAPYHVLFVSFLVLTAPAVNGMVIGFLLLDQRDDRTLPALQVTPLGLDGYLLYRLAMPVVLSVVMTIVAVPLTGLMQVGLAGLVVASLASAPLAPLFALLLASFASNKLQGFALTKAAGVLNWPPLLAFFLPLPWQWLAGILPTYWPAKLYWVLAGGEPYAPAYLAAGIVYDALLMALLLRRFHRVMTR